MEAADNGSIYAEDTPLEAQEAELVIRHSDRSCEPPDQVIDRGIIDDDGDVLVQTSSKELLVSSKILALASPVFKAMFSSKFLEGSTIRSVQNPLKLPLPYDNPDALAVLFHTLHFSSKQKFLRLGAVKVPPPFLPASGASITPFPDIEMRMEGAKGSFLL